MQCGPTISFSGNVSSLYVPGTPRPAQRPKRSSSAKRGACLGFSWDSFVRLYMTLHALPAFLGRSTMVTLTFTDQSPRDGRFAKQCLRRFRERLMYKYGTIGILWKQEFQRRGAIHYLLAVDLETISLKEFRRWCQKAWREVSDGGRADVRHHRDGVALGYFLKRFDDPQHIVPPGFANVGRFWGIWNITMEVRTYQIPLGVAEKLRPLMFDRWRNQPWMNGREPRVGYGLTSMSIVVDRGDSFVSDLEDLVRKMTSRATRGRGDRRSGTSCSLPPRPLRMRPSTCSMVYICRKASLGDFPFRSVFRERSPPSSHRARESIRTNCNSFWRRPSIAEWSPRAG